VRYSNKQIAILGLGESGEAAALLAAKEGAMVTVLDSGEAGKLRERIERLRARGVRITSGPAADADREPYDLAILSPGIDPAAPLVQNFIGRRIDMIGELEFAYELCHCPVIAITGTNGKTTTTQLVAQMLQGSGFRTIAAGNISPAFSAVVEQSRAVDVITLEVSSFQLERIRTFRPKISVWLNFAPDHLDRYASMQEYFEAKLRVFENQTEEDFAVVKLGEHLPPIRPRKITFSASAPGGDFELRDGEILFHGESVLRQSETRLRGLHNAENLMAALATGIAMGVPFDRMREPLLQYSAMPHRCEWVGTVKGVDYINDSKATNLDALEKALMGETRPVVLIAGGKDKGFEFDSIASLIACRVRCAVLIGEMAERIERSWHGQVACVKTASLAEAVEQARARAQAGDVVLFSPGTSSFDMFKNYADRGNQFRALVKAQVTS
jgi:UDP-N-acetylmuramoylalanine--D-glutamate ligase